MSMDAAIQKCKSSICDNTRVLRLLWAKELGALGADKRERILPLFICIYYQHCSHTKLVENQKFLFEAADY